MIYDFITPSDAITFTAEDPKVAYCCALILGSGKACVTSENGDSLPTCFIFADEATIRHEISKFLGCGLRDFTDAHTAAVADCFDSFAYGKIADRKDYEAALRAITDPAKLAEFRAHHEDQRRTSMSRWVQAAWNYARSFRALAHPPITA